jgi:hypothetical protein
MVYFNFLKALLKSMHAGGVSIFLSLVCKLKAKFYIAGLGYKNDSYKLLKSRKKACICLLHHLRFFFLQEAR